MGFSSAGSSTPWTQYLLLFISGKPKTDTTFINLSDQRLKFCNFRSRGEAKAMFLRHEGFLGALGAFTSYKDQSHTNDLKPHHHTVERAVLKCSDDDSFRHIPVSANVNDGEAIECSINLV